MGITTGPGRLSGQERRPPVDARAGAAGTRIDLDGVCRWFGAGDTVVKAVDDVNLHVDEAAFVVVLGPSGSGKTTLLNLIGALDAPTAGTIRLAGRDLTTASRAERTLIRRHTVSFIFQSFNLFPALTALENVQFGADVAGRPDAAGIAMQVLGQVGLAERASHFAHQLSGGEQQRVAIARALATGNRISAPGYRSWNCCGPRPRPGGPCWWSRTTGKSPGWVTGSSSCPAGTSWPTGRPRAAKPRSRTCVGRP